MTTKRCRIFISHASKGDKESTEFRDHYCRELEKRFDVLVDLRLGEGEWRADLFQDMLRADAAVILLGGRSPSDSPWLACEAFLFRIRKLIDPAFKVYPVRLPSVDQEDLLRSRWLEPAGLGELTIFPSDNALQKIEEEVGALIPLDLYGHEIERFVEHLVRVIDLRRNGGLCVRALERAHDAMGLRVGTAILPPLIDSLVYQFTRRPLPTSVAGLCELPLAESDHHEALKLMAPLWIPYEAARGICSYVRAAPDKRAFTLNSGQSYEAAAHYTAEWYVRRGLGYPCVGNCCSFITLEGNAALSEESLIQSIERKLVRHLRLERNEILEPQIQRYFRRGRPPVIVVLPEMITQDTTLISDLKRRYPGVTWMHVVNDAASTSASWLDDDAPLLRPLLDSNQEFEAIEAYQDQMNELTPEIRRPHAIQKTVQS